MADKKAEEKILEKVDAEKVEELKKDIMENKEEIAKKKGKVWPLIWKWVKILALPITAVLALIWMIAKGVIFGGKDDDELTEDEPADNNDSAE